MRFTDTFSTYFNRFFVAIRLPLCFAILFIASSCKQNKQETGFSESFKPINAKVAYLFGINKETYGLHYLDSSLNQIHPTNDDRFKAYSFHYVYALKAKNDTKSALLYADSMLYVANLNPKDPQYFANYAEANFALGDVYFNLQQYNDAYQCFFRGYQTGKSSLNSTTLAAYSYRLGMITYKMGDYKLAANYFKKSFYLHTVSIVADKFVEFYARQEILDNIGLSYKHNNQPDSAIFYFDKALKYINDNGFQFTDRPKMAYMASGVVYGNKAEVLMLKGDYKTAEALLKKSIEINLRKDYDNNDAALTEIKLAQLYYDHNENEAFYSLLNTIHRQEDSIKNTDVKADWNRLMAQYFIRKKDLPKAMLYLQTYNTLKDSNLKKLELLRESDVNKQIDTYEKQKEIQDLSVKNSDQKIYIIGITLFALMTCLIISLVYRNWKRSKKDVLTVSTLNRQIHEQNVVLGKALGELKDNSQEKDRILRAVAHDLRNPLGGIASLTSIMADDECTDEQRDNIDLIRQTSYNALELINEILEATNIASVELIKESAEVNSLVNNSVELLRFKASEKNQQIDVLPVDEELHVNTNREKAWRVLSNLVSNAIKFSPAGASIIVKTTVAAKQVIIAIEDNGIGIPALMKEQVFNMFTAAQRPGTAGEKSFGLGLSICKQIMDKLGGKIWFEDNPKGGTIFSISLPLVASEESISSQKIGVPLS